MKPTSSVALVPLCICPTATYSSLPRTTFLDLTIEGVGTKVLLAQLAGKIRHYRRRCCCHGSQRRHPLRRHSPCNLRQHSCASQQPAIASRNGSKGIVDGANQSECPVVSGEIGDVAEIINGISAGAGFDMVVASIGEVAKDRIITGYGIKPGRPNHRFAQQRFAQQRHHSCPQNLA